VISAAWPDTSGESMRRGRLCWTPKSSITRPGRLLSRITRSPSQVASISVPEPTQLLIKPYDKGAIREIERGLINADLGMAPQNDGEVLRLNVPPLSTERRQQLISQAKEFAEKSKVALRNIRRDTIKHVEQFGKEEKLPEDEVKKSAESVTETMKQYESKVEKLLSEKSTDLADV
jgi:ribosome recycling factor